MLKLEEITKDNFKMAIEIKVTKEQDLVIAPTVYSLAQCYLYTEMKPFLIMKDDVAVGFILFVVSEKESFYEICRFMIDKNHQRKGYGKEAMILAIDYLKSNGAKTIELSHRTDNPHPSKLYLDLGFEYTGIIEGYEKMMKLTL